MNKIADVLTFALLIGGVMVATRPGSKGPQLLTAAGNSFAHVEQAATGQKLK